MSTITEPGLVTGPRPDGPPAPSPVQSLVQALNQALLLAGRALRRLRRNPEQFIDVTLQPVIFLVMFVYLFGGAISGGQQAYLQYLLPGLMVQNVLFTTVSVGVNLNADIRKGVFDRFRSLPITRSAPLVGAVLAEVVRYLASVVVLVGTGVALGFRFHAGSLRALLACALIVAFGMCACWLSVFVGMIVRSEGSVQGIVLLLMLPLTFAASTFVPTDTLPGWLQAWVRVNPVNHVVEAARNLMNGGPVAGPLAATAVWAVVLVGIFAPLAVAAYRRKA